MSDGAPHVFDEPAPYLGLLRELKRRDARGFTRIDDEIAAFERLVEQHEAVRRAAPAVPGPSAFAQACAVRHLSTANDYLDRAPDAAASNKRRALRKAIRAARRATWQLAEARKLNPLCTLRITDKRTGIEVAVTVDQLAARARYLESFALSRLGTFFQAETALAAINEALTLLSDDAENHAQLGYTLLRLGRADEARSALEKAIELDPDCLVAQRLLDGTERVLPAEKTGQAGPTSRASMPSGRRFRTSILLLVLTCLALLGIAAIYSFGR